DQLRTNRTAIGFGSNKFYAQPMMLEVLIVAEEQGSAAGLREHHIEVAIAIDVCKRGPATNERLEQIAAGVLLINSGETRPAFRARVPKKLRGLAIALALLQFHDFLVEVTVRREHVEPAIEIVVE